MSLIGLAVAVAVWIASADRPTSASFSRLLPPCCFGRLYVPVLLTPEQVQESRQAPTLTPPEDELSGKIAEVERELDTCVFQSRRVGRRRFVPRARSGS